jgi:MFS family permease
MILTAKFHLTPRQKRILPVVLCGGFFEGFDFMIINLALPFISKDMNLSTEAVGLALSIVAMGSCAGFLVVRLGDKLGRKPVFLGSIAGYSILSLLTALAFNIYLFVALQFLVRVFLIGVWSTGYIIVTEEFEAQIRGRALGLFQSVSAIGAIFTAVLMMFIARSPEFRADDFESAAAKANQQTVVRLADALAADIGPAYSAASPRTIAWLNDVLQSTNFYETIIVRHQRRGSFPKIADEIRVLANETERYRHLPWAQRNTQQKKTTLKLNRLIVESLYPDVAPGLSNHWRVLFIISAFPLLVVLVLGGRFEETKKFSDMKGPKPPFSAVFAKQYRPRMIAIAALWFVIYLCYSSSMSFFSYHVVRERGWSESQLGLAQSIAYLIGLAGYFVAGRLLDTIGRRKTAYLFFFFGSIFTIAAFQLQSFIPIVVTLTFAIFTVGVFTVIGGAFTNELFPTSLRVNANAWGNNIIGRTAQILVPALVGFLAQPFGNVGNSVSLMAIGPIIGIGIVYFFLPETLGRDSNTESF